MSWLSNLVRGKHPMTRGADGPLVKPPAGGPSGSTPGQVFPIGPKDTGKGNIPQTTIPTVGVQQPRTGGSMTGENSGGSGGFDWKQWLLDNWDDVAKLGLGALTTREALQNSGKSNELMEEGINLAREDYAGRAPYRDAAMLNMLDPRTPDLSGIFANSGNPYMKGKSLPVVGNRIPTSATMPKYQGGPPTTTGDVFALGNDKDPLAKPGQPIGPPITNPPHMPPFQPKRNLVPTVGRY